jgi:hypothetical protein
MDDAEPLEPTATDSPTSTDDSGVEPEPGDRSSAKKWIIAAIVITLVVVVAFVGVLLIEDTAAIHDGPGTATFTWTPVAQITSAPKGGAAPQPFTAEINGHSATGTASMVLDPQAMAALFSGSPSSKPVPEYRYTGRFAGRPFSFVLSFQVTSKNGLTIATASSATFRFSVSGHFDDMPVTAVVTVPPQGPTHGHPAHLTGTIGHWHISADIPNVPGSSSTRTVTVPFVVSG